MILETLVEYEISLSQVYTITTDNGSNMLLAVKLWSEERRSSTNNDGNIEECFIKEFLVWHAYTWCKKYLDYVEDEEDGILDLLESQRIN